MRKVIFLGHLLVVRIFVSNKAIQSLDEMAIHQDSKEHLETGRLETGLEDYRIVAAT